MLRNRNKKEDINMFDVDMSNLKKPLINRGLTYDKNDDGTVTINGVNFDRTRDIEDYLESIPRKDIPA